MNLTPREAQVVELIGSGQTYKAASAEMGCSPRTVREHVTNAAKKLRSEVYAPNGMRFAPRTVVRLHYLESLREAGGIG